MNQETMSFVRREEIRVLVLSPILSSWADVTRSQCAYANLSRNGTAEISNRDKIKPWRLIGRKFAVSGSDSDWAPRQNPAKAREYFER